MIEKVLSKKYEDRVDYPAETKSDRNNERFRLRVLLDFLPDEIELRNPCDEKNCVDDYIELTKRFPFIFFEEDGSILDRRTHRIVEPGSQLYAVAYEIALECKHVLGNADFNARMRKMASDSQKEHEELVELLRIGGWELCPDGTLVPYPEKLAEIKRRSMDNIYRFKK